MGRAGGVEPDAVIVLDLPDAIAEARVSPSRDRFERAGAEFHARVRRAYRDLAPARGWMLVDAGGTRRVAAACSPRARAESFRRLRRRGHDGRRTGSGARAPCARPRPGPVTRICSSAAGSGVEDAAREFAAMLIGVADDERGRRLVDAQRASRRRRVRAGGASYRVKDDVRERILPEAARAPIEGERKVLVLFEAERLRGNQNESANAMLKTLEEPPDAYGRRARHGGARRSAADDPVALPAHRFRSGRRRRRAGRARTRRCRRADAARCAALAGGQLARARALAGSARAACGPRSRRRPARVDGYGATALAIAQELDAAVEEAAAGGRAPAQARSSPSSTPRWSGSATPTATRSGCGGGSTSGTSARRGAPASTC